MDNLQWHKDSAGSYFATNANGQRIATARKEATGGAWIGTVVGLGFTFGGRRLMDVKELAQRHVERIYGEGVWELFPARDLKPGMVITTDTMREEREIVSVSVDTDAQTVSVELSSESSRELGFNLDAEYAVGEYVRVRVVPTEGVRAENLAEGDVLHFADGEATVVRVERVESSLSQYRVCYAFRALTGAVAQCAVTVYPGTRFERTVKPAERVTGAETVEETPEDVPAVEEPHAAETAEEPAPAVLLPVEAVYLEPGDRVVTPAGTMMTVKRVRRTPKRPGHLTIICAEHFSFGRWADQEVMVTSFAAPPDEPLARTA
ncbi:hypothetical protein BU52_10765 [Streptomyces toyocaensis]|uniref:Uncharacterized protein n=1 Tax=Streptomyces toyocaensis TaxID=55952 RepID=A0A081XU47_STRTO|nr:hypothetical protein [Streptomyces toyocaensis]KES07070.1 hypothetical protein BU52_10765 [Streptomyces toyocaensis]